MKELFKNLSPFIPESDVLIPVFFQFICLLKESNFCEQCVSIAKSSEHSIYREPDVFSET
jgi:hypothetical protein